MTQASQRGPATLSPDRPPRIQSVLNSVLAVLFTMAWHTTLPLVPVYAVSLGARPFTVGLIVSSNVILPLLLALHVGAAADRFGTTRVSRWSAMIFVVSYALVAAGRGLNLLAVGLAGVGFADIGLIVSAQTYVAVTSTAETRDRHFAHLALWMSLGALIGPVLGGFLADRWGYRAAFSGSLVLAALTLAATLILPAPRLRSETATVSLGGTQTLRQAAALVRDPGVGLLLLMSAALMFGTSVRQSFFPLYLRSIGFSTTLSGVIFSVNSLCQMAIRPTLPIALRHMRHVGVLALALGTTIIGIVLTPRLTSFWALTAAFGLVGAGTGLSQPLTMSLVSGRATSGTRGLALGLRMTINQLAQVVGPPVLGVIVGGFGLGAAFYVAAIVAASGFAFLARLARTAASASMGGATRETVAGTSEAVAGTSQTGAGTGQTGAGTSQTVDGAERPQAVPRK